MDHTHPIYSHDMNIVHGTVHSWTYHAAPFSYDEQYVHHSSGMTFDTIRNPRFDGVWNLAPQSMSYHSKEPVQYLVQQREDLGSSCTTPSSSYTSLRSGSEWPPSEPSTTEGSIVSSEGLSYRFDMDLHGHESSSARSEISDHRIPEYYQQNSHLCTGQAIEWTCTSQAQPEAIKDYAQIIYDSPVHVLDSGSEVPQQPTSPQEVRTASPTLGCDLNQVEFQQSNKDVTADITEVSFAETKPETGNDGDETESSNYSTPKKRSRGSRTSTSARTSTRPRRKSVIQTTTQKNHVTKRRSSSQSTKTNVRRLSSAKKRPALALQIHRASNQGANSFPCVFRKYGCTNEFANKNEWKRHVSCQHLRLGFFRCDLGNCDPDRANQPTNTNRRQSSQILAKQRKNSTQEKVWNLFYRKDLFTQHCRRMHGPTRDPALCTGPRKRGISEPTEQDKIAFEKELEVIRARCWEQRRPPPLRSNCEFCEQVFDADYFRDPVHLSLSPEEKAWEQRMEHISQHIEKGHEPLDSQEDDFDLIEWGLRYGVFQRLEDGRCWLIDGAPSPSSVNPANRFENADAGARRRSSRSTASKRRPVEFREDTPSVEDSDAEAEDE